MNKSNNKRKKASIEKIEKAFLDLIQSKPLNQITISELCKQAEINRSTFYANYLDIYDLAHSLKIKVEEGVKNLYRQEVLEKYNSNDYLKLFKHIQANQMLYKTYFQLGYDDNYEFFTYDHDLAKEHFQNRWISYHIAFFKSGLTQIIKMWLETNCQESPEEMFEILQSEYQGR